MRGVRGGGWRGVKEGGFSKDFDLYLDLDLYFYLYLDIYLDLDLDKPIYPP